MAQRALACSAYQIIHDINKQIGWRDLIYDSLVIKDEYQKEYATKLKAPYNFFKHADKDHESTIEFDPELTNLFIMFSCLGLELLNVPSNSIRNTYVIYFSLLKPQFLTAKRKMELNQQMSQSQREDILRLPKRMFFETFIHYT